MRRKGEARISTKQRAYPFAAELQVRFHRRPGECERECAAAAAISAGDYRTAQPKLDSAVRYLFRSGEQAHAMQIWLEAHATPYDPWEERRQSAEASRRHLKECADMVTAAVATGLPARLRRAEQLGFDMVEALRMLEPRFDTPRAQWCIGMLNHYGAF